ncbi:hypothetical protein [Rhodovastum atsumiense]|uniref:Uncharacterized protein n=1 Tax=Rhodovastum atsumiense TaxID=504468 RepID=A0A5M6IT98_9PROT|nr:hypothetical protein [Rhodovastum atsumiense]KAA5611543.1 hypothetical protein F1189_13330 [Rhodovastum atsumiense]
MRDREAARGRNAKGNPPKLMALLHTESVTAIRVDVQQRATVQAFERVTSRTEAAILAARRAGGPVAIGRPALVLPAPEVGLWGAGLPVMCSRRPVERGMPRPFSPPRPAQAIQLELFAA